MQRRFVIIIAEIFLVPLFCIAEQEVKKPPLAIHPKTGTSFKKDSLSIILIDKKQNYNWADTKTRDGDIFSPKSVNFHPYADKFYINSLEGGTTVVFNAVTREKIKVIRHTFTKGSESLWAKSSGLFKFRHPRKDSLYFTGKPVESTFSHKGRYLWVPYYRRSFDLNAQEPSAVSVIDTRQDTVVKLFETGPLPKMIATSPDGTLIAITHWGDNTVGVIDISAQDPEQWRYIACHTVDYKLNLNLPTGQKVNRDVNSGYCLRGTVFTPDNDYLLVGCMGGGGGIAVIDLKNSRYLGRMLGCMPNLRHIVIDHGYLYCSINSSGYVERIPLDKFMECAMTLTGGTSKVTGWQICKVAQGARTLVISPDGRYLFAACNFSSNISIVETSTMTLMGTIKADSFPVGLDISRDGSILISTSQGRSGSGGNAVDIFEITYPEQKDR